MNKISQIVWFEAVTSLIIDIYEVARGYPNLNLKVLRQQ